MPAKSLPAGIDSPLQKKFYLAHVFIVAVTLSAVSSGRLP